MQEEQIRHVGAEQSRAGNLQIVYRWSIAAAAAAAASSPSLPTGRAGEWKPSELLESFGIDEAVLSRQSASHRSWGVTEGLRLGDALRRGCLCDVLINAKDVRVVVDALTVELRTIQTIHSTKPNENLVAQHQLQRTVWLHPAPFFSTWFLLYCWTVKTRERPSLD